LKIKRLLTEKKGMTLVELIITFVVAAILIASSSALIISSTNMIAHTTDKTMNESAADAILNIVAQRLRYASSVEVSGAQSGANMSSALNDALSETGATVFYIGDATGAVSPTGRGVLWFKRFDETGSAVNIFGDAFYHGSRIALQYTVDKVEENKTKAVTLTVFVYDGNGEQKMKRSTSLQLVNAQTADVSTMEPPLIGDTGKIYYDNVPNKSLILKIQGYDGVSGSQP
jgi:prepilin-type N-terminal cleavage/methylation domain-containing protein